MPWRSRGVLIVRHLEQRSLDEIAQIIVNEPATQSMFRVQEHRRIEWLSVRKILRSGETLDSTQFSLTVNSGYAGREAGKDRPSFG